MMRDAPRGGGSARRADLGAPARLDMDLAIGVPELGLTCKFSYELLGPASELGFGNRVIERKPLDESFP